jgi:hypothetical protein
MYARLFNNIPNLSQESKEKISSILQDIGNVSTTIEDQLYKIQIPDDELGSQLLDYLGENPDGLEKEFESLDWFDKQIAVSIKSGMSDNAIRILEQLLNQLYFIVGFLSEFKEKEKIGYKMKSDLKEFIKKTKLRRSRIREIIREEISKLKESTTPSVLNYQGGQYQFHFCEAVIPPSPTTNTQANNYACPNAKYIKANNCSDPNDTQNYYLVTEMDGQAPQMGDKYCGAATVDLDSVNGDPNVCNGPILEVVDLLGPAPLGYLVEPRKNINTPCGTTSGGICSQMQTPINQHFQTNVQGFGWEDTFTCLIAASNNPCSLIREKLRRWNTKLTTVGPNQASQINDRITFALDLGNNEHGCNNLQNLSPNTPGKLTGGGMNWDASDWENQFDNIVGNHNNPCNLLNNKLSTWNNKLTQAQQAQGPAGGIGWQVQRIDMLMHKIDYATNLLSTEGCI